MNKFSRSKVIVKESWAVLKQDKEIVWFPVISALVTTIVAVIFGTACYSVGTGNGPQSPVTYVGVFLWYLVTFFVFNFFQAGLYIIAYARFNGKNLAFKDGLRCAWAQVGKIAGFSCIAATVGVCLQILADRSKIIGKIVAAILGAAWNILTYFSLPSLVIGNTSVIDSFKESAAVIRKTWGETLIINVGVGFFFGVVFFLGTALAVGSIVLLPALVFVVVPLFIVFIIVVSVISSSLNAIFKLALYEYARTGSVPQGFSPELIRDAVKTTRL